MGQSANLHLSHLSVPAGSIMATSKPNTLQVSDLVQWYRNKELVINETFQRHAVWSPSAKTFLIDTMLNELPLPKIFIRTRIDPKTQTSIREVVDGQQRVRTFVDFADDKLILTSRSENYSGQRYSTLSDEEQQRFLSYTVSVEQLLNASDDDVIDIFARLNSYTVPLNAAEKRHAHYQTVFKFAVRKASQSFRWFIEKYDVFTVQKRFRMADDVFMAEVYGVFLDGIRDGGDPYMKKLYDSQDDSVFTPDIQKKVLARIKRSIDFLDGDLGDMLHGSHLSRHYHLLMLIAAYAHHSFGIPSGDLADMMPPRGRLASARTICDRLTEFNEALARGNDAPKKFKEFVQASGQRPMRIASRRVRFPMMVKALAK
jgi:hypothetical protein